MKLKRNKLLVEPPAGASSDIAFILIVFFLVCASVEPEQGRSQNLPNDDKEQKEQAEVPEVKLMPNVVLLDGVEMPKAELQRKLTQRFAQKEGKANRIVSLNADPEVRYDRWIAYTSMIEEAGGTITLQIEETKTQVVD
jgi:biopolymer transport protein ExbD